MKQPLNPRFKTFLLQRNERAFHVLYMGRRGTTVPDYKKPVYIRCLLEFDCEFIPVIDPRIWLRGEATPISSSMCVLVVEHSFECRKLRTGIVISDIQEAINLAAGNCNSKTKRLSLNMRFVLKLPKKAGFNRLLNLSHLELLWRERQKQADEDFASFEKKLKDKIARSTPSIAP